MRKLLTALFFSVCIQAVAQSPEVPHKLQFAGMTLTIRDDARREIQKDVDAITQSPKHFNIKAERARTYFPIIEKIFAEEGVPDDFKYLVIQESALIADAVSVSNAVGFWQFKEFTALEMGLRVDREIDERLNIASASRGAARYIKKNNFFFNNWIYALQAYQMGAGGVMQNVKDSQSGATNMEITSSTYWYVKKYLAHKVAYEGSVKGQGQISLLTYENRNRKTLAELSKEISVDEEQLRTYNKWVKHGSIPDDRMYLVMIPVQGEIPSNLAAVAVANTGALRDASKSKSATIQVVKPNVTRINGILIVAAVQGDSPAKIAARAAVDVSLFLKWNDISISDATPIGQHYLLGKKRARATEAYHKVLDGESLWSISQLYGVQLRKLRKYNRMKTDDVMPGTMLWLASMRPKDAVNVTAPATILEVDNQDSFAWNAEPANATLPVEKKPVVVLDSSVVEKGEPAVVTRQDSVQTLQVDQPQVAVNTDTLKSITIEPPVEKKDAHTVRAGETLYAIAKLYNADVMDLVRWNNLDLKVGIKPGQVIKLSDNQAVTELPPVTAIPETIIHEVRASDTLYSVARKYGVTIKELMDWNGKKDFSLSAGEKLKVVRK